MGSLKRFQKMSALWEDRARIFDLFGTGFISQKDFDKLRSRESKMKRRENDLELFIKDFWEAVAHYERKLKTTAEQR